MYAYKRFGTSKSVVAIILIALALVTWGVLGLIGNTLARKPEEPDEDQGKQTATFKLTYSADCALAFADGTETATTEISSGTNGINVFPARPNQKLRALRMPFLPDCFTPSGDLNDLVGVTHHTHMLVSQQKSDPGTALVQVWFDALGNDGESIVNYYFDMAGTIEGDWLPTKGSSTFVTSLDNDYWEIKPSKGKDSSVACKWEGPGLDWELKIEQ